MSFARRIYVASSWRNVEQQAVVALLRTQGHAVYDFRNPRPGDRGFHWSEIDPAWQAWSARAFAAALTHPIAERGFRSDFDAMRWADTGVLVLPCGRSAHLEAGYFVGAGKELYVLLADGQEPELMYRMATAVCVDGDELLSHIGPGALDGDGEIARGGYCSHCGLALTSATARLCRRCTGTLGVSA